MDQVQESLCRALNSLTAKDFRERAEALRTIDSLIPQLSNNSSTDTNLVQLLDAMTVINKMWLCYHTQENPVIVSVCVF